MYPATMPTLLSFHSALRKRKYRLLYSPRGSRNETTHSSLRLPRIAKKICLIFGLDLDKDIIKRVLAID